MTVTASFVRIATLSPGCGELPSILTITLALALAIAGLTPARAAGQEGLTPGATPAPVSLETLGGEAVELGSFLGKRPVLVEFWATWCAVCRALEPRLRAAHERFGDDVEFLVIAVGVGQSPPTIRRHLERHPQPGRVLWDADGAAVRAFDAPGTGVVFILDRTGTVAYAGAGADQDLETALERVAGDIDDEP